MNTSSLSAEREHLANLLEAAQRCTHFLYASSSKLVWPLDGPGLKQRQKDEALFAALAAFNERFAKLQDTLGAAMRHSALLMSETTTPFLKVLALFEKLGVIDSIASWQLCRTARNLAAHDYETDYTTNGADTVVVTGMRNNQPYRLEVDLPTEFAAGGKDKLVLA